MREALPPTNAERYLRAAAMTALWVAARTGLGRAFRDAGRPADDPLLLRAGGGPLADAAAGRAPGRRGAERFDALRLRARGRRAARRRPGRPAGRRRPIRRRCRPSWPPSSAPTTRWRRRPSRRWRWPGCARPSTPRWRSPRRRGTEARVAAAARAAGRPRRARHRCRRRGAAPGAGEAAGGGACRWARPGRMLDRAVRALRDWRPREPAAVFGLPRERRRGEYAQAALALLRRPGAGAAGRRRAQGGHLPHRPRGRGRRRRRVRGGAALPALGAPRPAPPAGGGAAGGAPLRRREGLHPADRAAGPGRRWPSSCGREFYLPILVAAKEHFGGMRHLADRGGVHAQQPAGRRHQLLRGASRRCSTLAQAIRRAFDGLRGAAGRARSPSAAVRRQLEAIGERPRRGGSRRRARRRAEAEQALPAGRAGAAAGGGARRARLARAARRGGAPAGGARAGPGPGPRRGAGGRGLHQLRRGAAGGGHRGRGLRPATGWPSPTRSTSRRAARRGRAAARLRADAAAGGRAARPAPRPAMQHAWSVFIGQPLAAAGRARRRRTPRRGGARRRPAGGHARPWRARCGRRCEAAARAPAEQPGDIYNSGAALSEEALEAYLDEVEARGWSAASSSSRTRCRPSCAPSSSSGPSRSRWWPASAPTARCAELFRRVGRAAFKGLGGVTVWELCAEGGGPAALCAALGPGWFQGASGSAAGRRPGPPPLLPAPAAGR
ncbi:MAG: hypothetical protein MZV70_54065 [Desulfobacterales bacterium]|nr:hypothetical protein [Desulfobacterales bacterium]